MPLEKLNTSGSFGPAEIATFSAALDKALAEIARENVAIPVSAYEARRQLAIGIMEAAKAGILDVDDLATEGLRQVFGGQRTGSEAGQVGR